MWRIRLFSVTAALLFATPCSYGQARSDWRFWTAADGLKESYSRKMSIGADGRVWVRHGAVSSISVLDGYTIAQVPEPRKGSAINWNQAARIYTGPTGTAWTVENHALMRFDGTTWHNEAFEKPGETMIVAMPVSADAVLVLFSDRLALYQTRPREWRVLKTSKDLIEFFCMIPGFHGDFWITSVNGVARLKLDAGLQVSSWHYRDTRGMGMVDADGPLPSPSGMDGYLTKPYSSEDLNRVLAEVLRNQLIST